MQIRITFLGTKNKIDLLVDKRQRVMNTLTILEESGEIIPDGDICKLRYVKSIRMNKQIPVYCSYEEAGIYSGDILKIDSMTM